MLMVGAINLCLTYNSLLEKENYQPVTDILMKIPNGRPNSLITGKIINDDPETGSRC